jgi:3-deoxy-7-phosphoheptulonate synthase
VQPEHAQLDNLNVEQQEVLITPEELKSKLPVSESVRLAINGYRETVRNIVDRRESRLLVVVGPCSIHDVAAAKEYAQRLKTLSDEIADQVFIVMRAYFEKPRSTVGWKGLINDPYLDDSFKVAQGLHIGRQLLLDLSEMGLPLATEALDPITPQYL